MKRFVEEYPEFRKLGGNVSKHVAIVGELSRLVERDKLLTVGEVEQGLASGGQGADLKTVQDLITNPTIPPFNKLKLVCLYALRHQRSQAANNIASLIELALKNGVDREDVKVGGPHPEHGSLFLLHRIARIRTDEYRRVRPTSGRSVLDRQSPRYGKVGTERAQGDRECVYAAHSPLITDFGKPLQREIARDELPIH